MICTPDDFRAAMRGLASGVSLVTTRDAAGTPHGMAATAVVSVSAEPPRLLVCVNRTASMHAPLLASGLFAVSFLAVEQAGFVTLFSSPEARSRRFDDPGWETLVTGAPVLGGAIAALDCRVAERFDAASHTMLLGDVVATRTTQGPAEPLVHFDGRLRSAAAA